MGDQHVPNRPWDRTAISSQGYESSSGSETHPQDTTRMALKEHNSSAVATNTEVALGRGSPDNFYRDYSAIAVSPGLQHSTDRHFQSDESLVLPRNDTRSKVPTKLGTRAQMGESSRVAAPGSTIQKPRQTSGSILDRVKIFENANGYPSRSSTGPPIAIPLRNPANILPTSRYLRDREPRNGLPGGMARPGQITRTPHTGPTSPIYSKSSQRAKFSAEDETSSNYVASATRSTKYSSGSFDARNSASFHARSEILARKNISRPLLFGEIISTSDGSMHPGFGIPIGRPRSASDTSLHPPVDSDASGSSYTSDWYREAPHSSVNRSNGESSRRNHARSKSDHVSSKPGHPRNKLAPSVEITSRLPIVARRTSAVSQSTSRTSSHASSPPVQAVASSDDFRKTDHRPVSPVGQSTTSGSRPSSRQAYGVGRVANGSTLPNSVAEHSPPLRTSRDRNSVATATTASSRSRATSRTGFLREPESRSGRRFAPGEKKSIAKRSIVDYGAGRARVKEGMRERIEAASKAQAARKELPDSVDFPSSPQSFAELGIHGLAPKEEDELGQSHTARPYVDTTLPFPEHFINTGNGEDSPTLGVPAIYSQKDDEISVSAISTIAAIDNEPQTTQTDMVPDPHMSDVAGSAPISHEKSLVEQDADSADHLSTSALASPISSSCNTFDIPVGLHVTDDITGNIETHQPSLRFDQALSDVGGSDIQASPPKDGLTIPNIVMQNIYTSPPVEAPPPIPDYGHNLGGYLDTPVTDFEEDSDLDSKAEENASAGSISSTFMDASHDSSRISQHSDWIEFSSHDIDEDLTLGAVMTTPFLQPTGTAVSRPESPGPEVPPKPAGYSPQPSPRFNQDVSLSSSQTQQSLTDLSGSTSARASLQSTTSLAPSASLLRRQNGPSQSSLPPPPSSFNNRTPPPPPQSMHNRRPPSSMHNRPSSSTHRISQNGILRDVDHRRESGDAYSLQQSVSSLRSSAQISLDGETLAASSINDQHLSTGDIERASYPPLPEAERERLFQRLWTIKELIDTEALYLKDMHVFEEIYKGTADVCPSLSDSDVDLLFRNIDQVVAFTTSYLQDLKASCASIYSPRSTKQARLQARSPSVGSDAAASKLALTNDHDEKDRKSNVAEAILQNLDSMRLVYTGFLTCQAEAAARMQVLKKDPAVECWLGECNIVAKDLTAAWDMDSLWSKPLQRITKLPLTVNNLLKHTPKDHPDYQSLQQLLEKVTLVVEFVNKQAIPKSVRKRGHSTSQKGRLALFGKLTSPSSKDMPIEVDKEYLKLHKTYSDDFLRLQVVLRDIENYTRVAAIYVQEFLQHLASIELVMRCAGSSTDGEMRWVGFSSSMRDLQRKHLVDHTAIIKQKVISPIEETLKLYVDYELSMKKRADLVPLHEKFVNAKRNGKKIDDKLEKFEADFQDINRTIKNRLEKLSKLTKTLGNLCLSQFVRIMLDWYTIWQQKLYKFLGGQVDDEGQPIDLPEGFVEIVAIYTSKMERFLDNMPVLSILDSDHLDRSTRSSPTSQPTIRESVSSSNFRSPTIGLTSLSRGQSFQNINGLRSNSLTAPKYRTGSSYSASPSMEDISQFDSRELAMDNSRPTISTPASPTINSDDWARPSQPRPGTGLSHESGANNRISGGGTSLMRALDGAYEEDDWFPHINENFGLFNSAMPMDDASRESPDIERGGSRRASRTSRASSQTHEGHPYHGSNKPLKTLYMAASLFEFNIEGIKTEAGYPYLTYPAGDIFDVIAEKGELWLAKNNEDPTQRVGWIWSKHFARFASSPEDAMPTEESHRTRY